LESVRQLFNIFLTATEELTHAARSCDVLLDVVIRLWSLKNKDVDFDPAYQEQRGEVGRPLNGFFITPTSCGREKDEFCTLLDTMRELLRDRFMRKRFFARWLDYYGLSQVHGYRLDPIALLSKSIVSRVAQVRVSLDCGNASTSTSWRSIWALIDIARFLLAHPSTQREESDQYGDVEYHPNDLSGELLLKALQKDGYVAEFTTALLSISNHSLADERLAGFPLKQEPDVAHTLHCIDIANMFLFKNISVAQGAFISDMRALIKSGLLQMAVNAATTLQQYEAFDRAHIGDLYAVACATHVRAVVLYSIQFPAVRSPTLRIEEGLSKEDWMALDWAITECDKSPILGLPASKGPWDHWVDFFRHTLHQWGERYQGFRKLWKYNICDNSNVRHLSISNLSSRRITLA
jgi:hypothetical protein